MTIYVVCVSDEDSRTMAFFGTNPEEPAFAYSEEAAIVALIENELKDIKANPSDRRSLYIDNIVRLPNREPEIEKP